MATINTCPEKSCLGISPRISFSHEHNNILSIESHHHQHHHHHHQQQEDTCHLDSSSDFVFCITNGVAHKLSSADELFSNGKIVPTQINRVITNAPQHQPHHQPPSQKKRLKEFLSEAEEEDTEEEKPNSSYSRYFWQFNRSSSLNCDGATRGKRLLRSSMQFMSRSYSTGSALNARKHAVIPRESAERHRLQKQSSVSSISRLSSSSLSSSSSSSSAYYFYDWSRKLSLNKNCGPSANGVRVSPVLNLPHRKVTRSFFGFGSLFCNGKKISRKR
ncbi:hypothetical protein RJT34_07279 [Clitoria ternatea]|uniref:Uncharacterized protein n=1 Tax=Clitoria ternatea TaxID=43366 RepID=A0AAN9K503_CLITE